MLSNENYSFRIFGMIGFLIETYIIINPQKQKIVLLGRPENQRGEILSMNWPMLKATGTTTHST